MISRITEKQYFREVGLLQTISLLNSVDVQPKVSFLSHSYHSSLFLAEDYRGAVEKYEFLFADMWKSGRRYGLESRKSPGYR